MESIVLGKYKIITNKRDFLITALSKTEAYRRAKILLLPGEEIIFNLPSDSKAILETLENS